MTNFRERVAATNGAEETIDESFMEDSDVLDELIGVGVSESDQGEAGSVEITAPKKADVTAMREIVLDEMSKINPQFPSIMECFLCMIDEKLQPGHSFIT